MSLYPERRPVIRNAELVFRRIPIPGRNVTAETTGNDTTDAPGQADSVTAAIIGSGTSTTAAQLPS